MEKKPLEIRASAIPQFVDWARVSEVQVYGHLTDEMKDFLREVTRNGIVIHCMSGKDDMKQIDRFLR